MLGGAIVFPLDAARIRVQQLHFEFGEEQGKSEIDFLVCKAVSRFLGSALRIVVVYLCENGPGSSGKRGRRYYALNSNAAPCATTECNVPLSQAFTLFSEPAVRIESGGLGKMSRVLVYQVMTDGKSGLE